MRAYLRAASTAPAFSGLVVVKAWLHLAVETELKNTAPLHLQAPRSQNTFLLPGSRANAAAWLATSTTLLSQLSRAAPLRLALASTFGDEKQLDDGLAKREEEPKKVSDRCATNMERRGWTVLNQASVCRDRQLTQTPVSSTTP